MSESTTPDRNVPMIGEDGGEFVGRMLAESHPQQAIKEIQEKCALQQPICSPLLGLVEKMGITKTAAHLAILKAAKVALLTRVPNLDRVSLERLLRESFSYLPISDLREVPIAVMEQLQKVPSNFLKDLAKAEAKAVFAE
jgi:hypothetical protein